MPPVFSRRSTPIRWRRSRRLSPCRWKMERHRRSATVSVYDKTKLMEASCPSRSSTWPMRAGGPLGRLAEWPGLPGDRRSDAGAEWRGSDRRLAQGHERNATAYRGNNNALKGVNNHEVEGAVIYHYCYFGDQAKQAKTAPMSPRTISQSGSGRLCQRLGGGVLASSKKQKEAQAYLKWITCKGAEILREGTSFEYAVGNGEASHPSWSRWTSCRLLPSTHRNLIPRPYRG